MSIVLHIERLVIDAGALGGERVVNVRASLEQELTRLLAQPGTAEVLRGIGAVATLPSAFLPATGHPNGRLGARIAVAVHHGLGIPAAPAANSRNMFESSHE